MSIKLDIKIDSTGRSFLLDNDEKIIIVFPADKDSQFSITCVSFSPFSDSNEVEFFTDYFLFGTTQDILPFEAIEFNDKVSVQFGDIYNFDGAGFTYKKKAFSNTVVGLLNNSIYPGNLTSGIAQKINVLNNEENPPISIGSVPQNQTIYFDLAQIVWIFVAKGISSNMIIPNDMLTPVNSKIIKRSNSNQRTQLIVGNYLEIDLTETTIVFYDNALHAFRI